MRYRLNTIRKESVLTTDYVSGKILTDAEDNNQLFLHINFTKGSLDSCEIKIEVSVDGEKYEQLTVSRIDENGIETLIPRTVKLQNNSNFVYPLGIVGRYIKVSAKGTGTPTGSSLAIRSVFTTV